MQGEHDLDNIESTKALVQRIPQLQASWLNFQEVARQPNLNVIPCHRNSHRIWAHVSTVQGIPGFQYMFVFSAAVSPVRWLQRGKWQAAHFFRLLFHKGVVNYIPLIQQSAINCNAVTAVIHGDNKGQGWLRIDLLRFITLHYIVIYYIIYC